MRIILLVEDDTSLQKTLRDAFEEFTPYTPVIASNGKEALTFLRDGNIDMVLTDLQMPEMDGIDLLLYMHLYEMSVPVLVMTAFSTPALISKLLDLGVRHVLEKPLELDTLFAVVDSVLATL